MGDARGFLKHDRQLPDRRSVPVRLRDWKEVYEPFSEESLRAQASRCMDCGIPFCNDGCPLGNLIPDWNDLTYRGHWRDAIERLHATNNFPEFTGRLCPAPCEGSCVLGINEPPVTIKQIEVSIVDRAWEEGWIVPLVPAENTRRVGCRPAAHQGWAQRGGVRKSRPDRRSDAIRDSRVQDGKTALGPPSGPDGGRRNRVPD